MRIHLLGASGSGCSSLGRALAGRLGCSFYDTDDYYWQPTDPPFVVRTKTSTRNANLWAALHKDEDWVLAGSISAAWGMNIVELITVAVYVDMPKSLRMARLTARETERYGDRIREGGDMYAASEAFILWSAAYDAGHLPGRSRARHEAWLKSLTCSKLVLDNTGAFSQVLSRLVGQVNVLSSAHL